MNEGGADEGGAAEAAGVWGRGKKRAAARWALMAIAFFLFLF